MATPTVVLIGPVDMTTPVEAALRRLPLRPATLTPAAALRRPGWCVGAALTVFTSLPGAQPTLEAECYAHATGALHVTWDDESALVGPFVAPGYGPCPSCLAQPAHPRGPGHDALAAWASAWTALHALAVVEGSSDVVGASWAWQLGEPGLALKTWRRRRGCPVAGCAQP
ncbi:hypothetical protein BCR15_02280 [Tessaracoccus lapidicaptus]|uniref:Uncharacterized protein n=1 Tax=Tessaracoccus lapidicaptus TaxID=1427523 RepID=A0A1C0AMT7_9ACTN|nr:MULTISPECIES: hypothetical protein [Tessaracoccus]AQX14792.1 hypothetical protein BKM78_01735 [Tessaracoccus sp. T2.5-30]OCL34549.1 hypothetical protein BCR15_02280 [Tessaracoccus lapidicaptus]VEP38894.1 hypothetical protein TLA_TLA_00354 [Tessaracoccus lapidicaptus]